MVDVYQLVQDFLDGTVRLRSYCQHNLKAAKDIFISRIVIWSEFKLLVAYSYFGRFYSSSEQSFLRLFIFMNRVGRRLRILKSIKIFVFKVR